MTTGRRICDVLKSIRREIASRNGIDLEIPECSFKGECAGTCPQCEFELETLEAELKAKDTVDIDGIGRQFVDNVEIKDSTEATKVYLEKVYNGYTSQQSEAIRQLEEALRNLEAKLHNPSLATSELQRVELGIHNIKKAINNLSYN